MITKEYFVWIEGKKKEIPNWLLKKINMENAVYDIPDERDIPYEWLVGFTEKTAIKFPQDRLIIQNQSDKFLTRMACSRFGLSHIVNGQTLLSRWKETTSGINLWENYLKLHPEAEAQGATLLSALAQWVKEKIISSYGAVPDVDTAKLAVDKWHFIYTGSSNGDWTYVREKHIYMLRGDWKVVGHCWVIIGYDDAWFIAINSYGQTNGYFHVPFILFGSLFTKYAVIPVQEINPVLSYKQKLMNAITIEAAKTALTNWFWNGERAQETITREEASALVERAYEKLLSQINK